MMHKLRAIFLGTIVVILIMTMFRSVIDDLSDRAIKTFWEKFIFEFEMNSIVVILMVLLPHCVVLFFDRSKKMGVLSQCITGAITSTIVALPFFLQFGFDIDWMALIIISVSGFLLPFFIHIFEPPKHSAKTKKTPIADNDI